MHDVNKQPITLPVRDVTIEVDRLRNELGLEHEGLADDNKGSV